MSSLFDLHRQFDYTLLHEDKQHPHGRGFIVYSFVELIATFKPAHPDKITCLWIWATSWKYHLILLLLHEKYVTLGYAIKRKKIRMHRYCEYRCWSRPKYEYKCISSQPRTQRIRNMGRIWEPPDICYNYKLQVKVKGPMFYSVYIYNLTEPHHIGCSAFSHLLCHCKYRSVNTSKWRFATEPLAVSAWVREKQRCALSVG